MQIEVLENPPIVEVLQNGFATHTRTHAEHLAKDYVIKNPKEVADFIGDNLFLLQLLEEIPAKIRTYFGKKQELILQFFADPEDVNWHRLLVCVKTKSAKDSRPKLDKFDEDWWIDNEQRSASKILINLEFVK